MSLKELVSKSDYVKVYDEWHNYYCKEKEYGNYDILESVLLKLNTMKISKSELDKIHVSVYEDTFQGETETMINVSGYVESEKQNYGLSFSKWNELAGLEIEQRNCDFSNEKLLAHVLWEITFDGFDEETIQKSSDELMERLKEAEDSIKNGNFKTHEEVMTELGFKFDEEE